VLRQRPIWYRGDVLPFIILYTVLMVFDDGGRSWYYTVYWITALLSHLSLILVCQWNDTVRVYVGYQQPQPQQQQQRVDNGNKEEKSSTSSVPPAPPDWTHAYITTEDGASGIVPVEWRRRSIPSTTTTSNTAANNSGVMTTTAVITFQDCVYRYHHHHDGDSSDGDWDDQLWWQTGGNVSPKNTTHPTSGSWFNPVRYPHDLPLSFYHQWPGHSTLSSCAIAQDLYGSNVTLLQLPDFWHLLGDQVTAPFFLFQLFCVMLWSLDEYWMYAIFTLFALLLFESTMAYQRKASLQRINDTAGRNRGGTRDRVTVLRCGGKTTSECQITTNELLPGDIIVRLSPGRTVPADLVLIRGGTAVCDEALLTGESIPQRKHALEVVVTTARTSSSSQQTNGGDTAGAAAPTTEPMEERLDLSVHKESILFAGTMLVAADADIVAIVLRTGFATAQGSLLRTMAHSSKTNSTDAVHTRDTFLFILLLVMCALFAAAFVLYYGWYDDRRNRFRLVLHVIILVTSVVPPELPLELSLAITNSVASLMYRCQVYCTEHYRMAWAGEITTCCFDKTGTLTSDTMLVKGVRLFPRNDGGSAGSGDRVVVAAAEEDAALGVDTATLPWESVRVMVGCQSLATTGRSIVGDPLERAVLEHAGYRLLSNDSVGPISLLSPPTAGGEEESNRRQILTIHHRFAFSSKLKRMAVLASEPKDDTKVWVLTKGAPETIKDRLAPDSIPPNYDAVSLHHMGRGRRVLALAYKEVGSVKTIKFAIDQGREAMEYNLIFAGFLVLECPLKPQTTSIISDLKKGGHAVVMITGDALLTAVEVSRQVGIIKSSSSSSGQKQRTVYRIIQRNSSSSSSTVHQSEKETKGQRNNVDPLSHFECIPLTAGDIVTTHNPIPLSNVKELLEMKRTGKVYFCISGDTMGEIAALSSSSTTKRTASSSSLADEKSLLLSDGPQRSLARIVNLVSVFARHTPHQKEAVIAAFNRSGEQTMMAGDGTNDVGALKRAHVGISIISAPDIEAKQRDANHKLSRAKARKKQTGQKANFQDSIRQLQEAQDDLAQVELGDASVAAPFTSRALNIRCCKDVIQQGRCTLVTMLQIYKVLGINCLVNALVLSKLFLHGAKQGDRQLTVLGMAVAALFYFVTRAEPLSTMSAIRPPASVLCLQVLLSISGQFIVHSVTILVATQTALSFVDPYDPSLVPDGPFNSNVLNTCTFLSTCLTTGTIQVCNIEPGILTIPKSVNTFAVNYRGRPFMKDLKENKLFYRSLLVCYAVILICTLELFPPLNEILQLAPLPIITTTADEAAHNPMVVQMLSTISFPGFLAGLMVTDTLVVFGLEGTIRRTFENRK
jgi:manganese-transporting P-type ATPase